MFYLLSFVMAISDTSVCPLAPYVLYCLLLFSRQHKHLDHVSFPLHVCIHTSPCPHLSCSFSFRFSLLHIVVLFPLLFLPLHFFFACQQHRSDCAYPTWKLLDWALCRTFEILSWNFLTYYLPPPCALRTFLHSPPGSTHKFLCVGIVMATCWKQRWRLLLCPQTCRWRARFRSGWRECFRKRNIYIERCLRVMWGLCRGMNHTEYCVHVMWHVCTLYVWSQHAKNYINAFGKSRCTSWSRNCMGLWGAPAS